MSSNKLYIPYSECESLLEEGDVALFRGNGIISFFIKIASQGPYSHVGVLSKHGNNFECIEYREFYGGRAVDFENYLKICKDNKTEVDIYRPTPYFGQLKFDINTKETEYKRIKFDGKKVTECMRSLTALPYSYRRIWIILKIHLFRLHLYKNLDKIINEMPTNEVIMPVCSTVVAHCFVKNNYYILRNRSSEFTEPNHFALSPRLNYLFTPTV